MAVTIIRPKHGKVGRDIQVQVFLSRSWTCVAWALFALCMAAGWSADILKRVSVRLAMGAYQCAVRSVKVR